MSRAERSTEIGTKNCTWLRRPKPGGFSSSLFSRALLGPTYLAVDGAWLRAARRGIWQGGTDIETPAEYKKRYRMGTENVAEPEDVGHEVEKPGLLSRIFGRRRDNISV
jgi:hypothetical protein